MDEDPNLWHGVVIAEGLKDPTLINELRVYQARISDSELPLDDDTYGRWHLYWVLVTPEQIDRIQAATKHEWYAHFWREDQLVVCFDDARYDLERYDRSSWKAAVDHGLGQGLRREWLDFVTDDGSGELE